ncbi:MAG: hypothetical protein HZA51_10650 [Planctomycetes bacterium]|nr:hypothetical protein [Planctomycetota bacterium]
MTIEMNQVEMKLIEDLVEQRIEALGPEIHHTDSRDYRRDLERTRDQLIVLQEKLLNACV